MDRILVTGGNGALGRELVSKLAGDPARTVRVMSRRQRPAYAPSHVEWAQADLATGVGVEDAVAGVQTIVHAASSPFRRTRQVDVEGTRRILEQARAAGVEHLIYISIVGVDRVPTGYYQAKRAAEEIIANGDVPWTILRATQFHYLLDLALSILMKFPIGLWFTDLPWQPVATEEVANALYQSVAAGPAGRLPDLGGPEVLSGSELARTWLRVRGKRRAILPVRLPGEAAEGFRRGDHTCPQNRQGKITWREWLERKYRQSASAPVRPTQVWGG